MRLIKSVPEEFSKLYLSNGWSEVEGNMCKDVSVDFSDSVQAIGLELPLLQTGTIQRPFGRFTGKTLVSAVQMHNMGNSVFENYALSTSLVCIREQLFAYKIVRIPEFIHTVNGMPCSLRIYCSVDTDVAKYCAYLRGLFDIGSNFSESKFFRTESLTTDFWWDIKTHLMFSFDRNFMLRLPQHVYASLNKL